MLRKKALLTKIKNKEKFPVEEYDGKGSWHHSIKISLNYLTIHVTGVIMGCGLGQIRGVVNLSLDQNLKIDKQKFRELLTPCRTTGMGAVLCTLGDNHIQHEKRVLEVGFEKLSTYTNYFHNSFYKQRLYILKL